MGMAALTEVQDRAEALRGQERLLAENLASGVLRGEQRRVQRALLRDTRRERLLAERAARAIEAGWEPFEPSTEWHWGFVEDPRFLRGRLRLASVLLALLLAALAGALLAMRWEVPAAAALAVVLWLGLQAASQELLGRFAQRRDAGRLGDQDELLIFDAPMPASAAVAYRRARQCGVFDDFVVYSPRMEDFRAVSAAVAPSLGLLDPVLAGRIGPQSFLISQWDLGRDVAG
jgi:hypothetical protein